MTRLLIATNNKGKAVEIRALLQDLPVQMLAPADIGLDLNVPEEGQSYTENAAVKAVAYARAARMIALADDSGLEVEALAGAPGLHSARYLAKPGATDAERRAYLLQNLRGKPSPWTARFRSAIAIAMPDGAVQTTEGTCEGEIISQERGTGGFGYDRLFYFATVGKTMAELSLDEKNQISHRAQAIRNARPILQSILSEASFGRGR